MRETAIEMSSDIYDTSNRYQRPSHYVNEAANNNYTNLTRYNNPRLNYMKSGKSKSNDVKLSFRMVIIIVVVCVVLALVCAFTGAGLAVLILGSQQCQSVESVSTTKHSTTASVGSPTTTTFKPTESTSGQETTIEGERNTYTIAATSLPTETTTTGLADNYIKGRVWALTTSDALTVMCPVLFPTNETLEWWVIDNDEPAPKLIYTNQNNPSNITNHSRFRMALADTDPVHGHSATVYGMLITSFPIVPPAKLYCTNGTVMPENPMPWMRYAPVLYDIYVAGAPRILNGPTSNATVGDIVEVSCSIDANEGFFIRASSQNGWWECYGLPHVPAALCASAAQYPTSHEIRDEPIGPGIIRRHMFFNLNITGEYPKYVFTCAVSTFITPPDAIWSNHYQYETRRLTSSNTEINVIG